MKRNVKRNSFRYRNPWGSLESLEPRMLLAGDVFDGGVYEGADISFGKSELQASMATRPTSLQFGPDGRLYVAQQNGLILAYEVTRNGPNSYSVANQEAITLIQSIPNHDDQGAVNPAVNTRLVTGILVTGTAQQPVIYVNSSDPRIGGGNSGADLNLDTNSGIISRLTWNGSQWDKLDLVRGLPRSEENHTINGLQLDPSTNTLYVTAGGNTNMGAPSNNFALLPEYALSAAILSIDLDAIGNTTYDLPTLNDENRAGVNDFNDPFGGNDGKNQARLVPGGPVQVYAPGFRNPYDLVITQSGRMYTVDNGPNAGWGDVPIGEGPNGNATNAPHEPGVSHGDGLHLISGPGYYGGHPNPTRSNPANTFNASNPQSPVSVANPIESDYQIPGVEDQAMVVYGASTNGIVEYTPATFNGAMQGDLLIASFDNSIKRVVLNSDGTVQSSSNLFSNVGFRPLDVTVAASGPFLGTVWVVDIALDKVFVFEPADGPGGDPDDLDGDGYSNEDEILNGTDPGNPGDVPPDNDGDFLSDLLDDDDDNDTLLDNQDPFAIDGTNGASTPLGTLYSWENDGASPGGILQLGFTGLMTNGVNDYQDLYDPLAVTAGGAAGVFTIDSATAGSAVSNTQQQGFQFGVNTVGVSTPYSAVTRLVSPFAGIVPQPGQQMGLYVGTGDQDNYVQLVLSGDSGGQMQVASEFDGVYTALASQPLSVPGPGTVDLILTVNPQDLTVQPLISVDNGPEISIGSPIAIPASLLDNPLAVGLISTDPTGSGGLPVTWDYLGTRVSSSDAAALLTINPGGAQSGSSTYKPGSFKIQNDSVSGQKIARVVIDISTAYMPDVVFDPLGIAGDPTGKDFTPDTGQLETGLQTHAFLGPHDGGFDALQIDFADFDPGELFTFSIDIDPTSIQGAPRQGPEKSGSISGFELSGTTVTVTFSDGSVLTHNTFGLPGSVTGSDANLVPDAPLAPTISLVGVGSTPSVLADPQQTLRITAAPGSQVRFQHVEAALLLDTVPDGGFDIDPFEANQTVAIVEQSITVGPSGVVDVPVTLVRSRAEGGLNYFLAAVEGPDGAHSDMASPLLVMFDPNAPQPVRSALVTIDPGGNPDGASTFKPGSFQIRNDSGVGQRISRVAIDISTAFLPDVVFDPAGTAGDPVGKDFTPDAGQVETGLQTHAFLQPRDSGFDVLQIDFSDFDPGELFTFSVDIDPTSIRNAPQPGPEGAGNVSGFELSGSTITVTFEDGSSLVRSAFGLPGSFTGADADMRAAIPVTPTLELLGVGSVPSALADPSQTLRVLAAPDSQVRILHVEAALLTDTVPGGGYDLDPFEANKALTVGEQTVTVGATGFVDLPVTLVRSRDEGGLNYFLAAVEDASGVHGLMAQPILVEYAPQTGGNVPVWYFSAVSAASATFDNTTISFDDSDILRVTARPDGTLAYSVFFDGSDVGLTAAAEDVDALAILADGSILVSTSGTANVNGLIADRQDILRFIPTSTGNTTAGSWELYLDGSDVGLDTDGENIVGLSVLADGSLAIATQFGLNVPGLSLSPQDLARFTPTQLGSTTAGSWSLLFDGSENGLATNGEKIDAVSIPQEGIYELSTQGSFSAGGVTGADEDVLRIENGAFSLLLDASLRGISVTDINAWHSQLEPDGALPKQAPPRIPQPNVDLRGTAKEGTILARLPVGGDESMTSSSANQPALPHERLDALPLQGSHLVQMAGGLAVARHAVSLTRIVALDRLFAAFGEDRPAPFKQA